MRFYENCESANRLTQQKLNDLLGPKEPRPQIAEATRSAPRRSAYQSDFLVEYKVLDKIAFHTVQNARLYVQKKEESESRMDSITKEILAQEARTKLITDRINRMSQSIDQWIDRRDRVWNTTAFKDQRGDWYRGPPKNHPDAAKADEVYSAYKS